MILTPLPPPQTLPPFRFWWLKPRILFIYLFIYFQFFGFKSLEKKFPKSFWDFFFQIHTNFLAPKTFKIIYYHNVKIQLEKENIYWNPPKSIFFFMF